MFLKENPDRKKKTFKEKKWLERFMKKNCKRQIKQSAVVNDKGDKSYVEWKDYNYWFTSWNDKKDSQTSIKGCEFLLGRIYFTGDDSYHFLFFFANA